MKINFGVLQIDTENSATGMQHRNVMFVTGVLVLRMLHRQRLFVTLEITPHKKQGFSSCHNLNLKSLYLENLECDLLPGNSSQT